MRSAGECLGQSRRQRSGLERSKIEVRNVSIELELVDLSWRMKVQSGLHGGLVWEHHQGVVVIEPTDLNGEVPEVACNVLGLGRETQFVDVKAGFAFRPFDQARLHTGIGEVVGRNDATRGRKQRIVLLLSHELLLDVLMLLKIARHLREQNTWNLGMSSLRDHHVPARLNVV